MAITIQYKEFISKLPTYIKQMLDYKDTTTANNLVELTKIPSYVFSMMTPKLEFYRDKGGQKDYLKLFYRPRKFPSGGISQKNIDRGNVAGIQSFTFTSNEYMGTIRKNIFEMKFEVTDPEMFKTGHIDEPDIMEFFKIKRKKNELFIINFGWNRCGVKEVDKASELLMGPYPITVNTSNWKIGIDTDRKTSVTVLGWTGVSEATIKSVFMGTSFIPALKSKIDDYNEKSDKLKKDRESGQLSKGSEKELETEVSGIVDKMYPVITEAFKKIMENIKKKAGAVGRIEFKDLLETFESDIKLMEQTSGVSIQFVLGEYNNTKSCYFTNVFGTGNEIGRVAIPVSELEKNYFKIQKGELPYDFNRFLSEIISNYVGNDGYLRGNIPPNSQKETSINVKINYIPYEDKIYILIDDVNRYYKVKELMNTMDKSLKEKTDVAEANNIPIIDLERMNNVVIYPLNMETNVDESLMTGVIIKKQHEKQQQMNKIDGTEKEDFTFPYQYYPINAPFSMMGNFLLKPFQTVFIKWGSEKWDRFYMIYKLDHKINDSSQFITSYETRQISY